MNSFPALAVVAIAQLALSSGWAGELRINADFPGGNIVVERIEGNDVYVHQDLRDTRGDWFYWCLRVSGGERRELDFHFTRSKALGLLGPAVSRDEGATWQWLGRTESPTSFKYRFSAHETDVRFCFGMAYQDARLQQFLATYRGHPALKRKVFAETKKGTPVEMLRLGRHPRTARYKVLVTARHHACEMMASYVAEGLVEEFLGNSATAGWMQERVDCVLVPMVDKDGVENGDQGKNRLPHDHKADYRGPSIYPEVAALRTFVAEWANGKADVTLDLHNPNIDGNVIYTHALRTDGVTMAGENAQGRNRAFALQFLETIERVRRGPLPFLVQDSVEFAARMAKKRAHSGGDAKTVKPGRGRNAGDGVGAESAKITVGFEIPYAVVRGVEVNAESARALGRDLTVAICEYLKTLDAPGERRTP